LLRDRDGIYGKYFQQRVARMGIEQVCTAPRSPWQNLLGVLSWIPYSSFAQEGYLLGVLSWIPYSSFAQEGCANRTSARISRTR
jgi:hypothetical protein